MFDALCPSLFPMSISRVVDKRGMAEEAHHSNHLLMLMVVSSRRGKQEEEAAADLGEAMAANGSRVGTRSSRGTSATM